jgi:cellulose biosynthesis protein BcsQ
MSATQPTGQVITFYSYKGGTGRSMALANVACLLARKWAEGKDVLMIDWDLEAPGLHRFFQGRLTTPPGVEGKTTIDEYPGLIDLFRELNDATYSETSEKTEQTEERAKELLRGVDLDRFILPTSILSLKLMKAGRFDDQYQYSVRVNSFQWEEFYRRSPWLIRAFAERLTERYRYVLIDSRTGFTDISGICTMLMPERLVAVFTPNYQSLSGVLNQVRRATDYRRQSDDLRPLVVFPLPSRIEAAEPQLREDWRLGNSEKKILGYQPQFETLFKEIYDLPECALDSYFDEVQIQHIPRYAYGEEIAVLTERTGDRLSLRRSYESFTERLVGFSGPWEEKAGNEELTTLIDVFIDYTDKDLPQAKLLGSALRQRGFNPWIRHEHVPPGKPFHSAAMQATAQAKAILVLVGSEERSTFQYADYLNWVESVRKSRVPVIPVILPSSNLNFLPIEWQRLTPVVAEKVDDAEVLDELERGITGKKPSKAAPHIEKSS